MTTPCWLMTYRDWVAMVGQRNRAADLLPSLLVLVLAVLPHEQQPEGMACLSDGPGFTCWLESGPSLSP